MSKLEKIIIATTRNTKLNFFIGIISSSDYLNISHFFNLKSKSFKTKDLFSTMLSFTAKGHPQITGEHKSTLEFTKDDHISGNGDCILGICSNHDISELTKLSGRVIFVIKVNGIEDTFEATIPKNHKITDEKELVIRKSTFISNRTYAVASTKSSLDIDRNLIESLKKGMAMQVFIYEKSKSTQ